MRQVIHLDLDAFFASVEVLENPSLVGKPIAVAMGNLEGRGVVTTASYPARKFGVHSAMPLRQAVRLCPQLVIVPARHRLYSEYSRRVMDCLSEYSTELEQVSIDEAYIEISADRDASHVAAEMQDRIRNEFGLDCTLAVASNKVVAKIACNTVKPRGLITIEPGREAAFLAPLPIDRLPFAGPATRARLERWNVKTIGDLARVPGEELRAEFGKHGAYLAEASHGRDDSPVVRDSKPKSISQENTFERDTRDAAVVERELEMMCEGVARELEGEGYLARTVTVKLRYANFTTITRQVTLRAPTAQPEEIRSAAIQLLRAHWTRLPVRLIGVGASNLVGASGSWQMELGI